MSLHLLIKLFLGCVFSTFPPHLVKSFSLPRPTLQVISSMKTVFLRCCLVTIPHFLVGYLNSPLKWKVTIIIKLCMKCMKQWHTGSEWLEYHPLDVLRALCHCLQFTKSDKLHHIIFLIFMRQRQKTNHRTLTELLLSIVLLSQQQLFGHVAVKHFTLLICI